MAQLTGRGTHQKNAGPPRHLLIAGGLGLLVSLVGRFLGGDWGLALVAAGAGLTIAAGMLFFLRLWAWVLDTDWE